MENDAKVLRWKEWNHQGFIPAQEETEALFEERIAFCLNLEKNLEEKGARFPFHEEAQASHDTLQEAFTITEEQYGIRPTWVPIFFSNSQLAPWHGGCAWIFQLDEQTPLAAFLQLRSHFKTYSKYWGIYQRKELVAHELAHVGRMTYQDPKFEEFFAYQSSSNWRKWWGPLFQSSTETLCFILLLGLILLIDIAILFSGHESFIHEAWWLKILPCALIGFACVRLFYRHYILNTCLKKLKTLYPSFIAKHLLYRLKDEEIATFSHLSPKNIEEWIEKNSQASFRWNFLKHLYPFSKS